MNILMLSWRGPGHPNAGGAEISTHEHIRGWVRAGHHVVLFTSYYQGSSKMENIDGVIIIRCGHQVFGVQLEAFWWYLFGDHPKFDIVIDQFHGIPFFTPLFVRTQKLAFIHEVAKEVWWLNSWQKPLNLIPAIIGTVFEPLVFSLFYRRIPFMTVSESTKKDLIHWGIPEDKIIVIHNGVNKPKRVSVKKEKKKTLIFLGALSKDKGIEDAINVFSEIFKKEKDWQFWVVGKSDPQYLIKIKKLVNKLGLSQNTKFWGYISEEKKFELLAKAHILINPSVREGWGLVVIEAASVGTPTVAYDVPGLRDSIVSGKTGLLCAKKDVIEMAEKIINLLEGKKEYQRMKQNANIWSRNFSWERSVKKSLSLIHSLSISQ